MKALTYAAALVSAFLLFLAPIVDTVAGVPRNSAWEVTDLTLTYGLEVTNLGTAPAVNATAKIALLGDFLPFQDVLESAPLLPQSNASVDSWNNSYVLYRLPAVQPGATLEYLMRSRVRLLSIDYAIDDGRLDPRKAPEFAAYLAPEPYIESDDPNVVGKSQEIGRGARSVHEYSLLAFTYTANHLQFVKQPEERGAAFALRSRTGQAQEYADLYAALLRAHGVPAGRLNGFAGDLQPGGMYFGEELSHAWTRVYYEGVGWVPSDPAWGDRQAFENFAKSDGRHLAVTEGVGRKASFFVWNRTLNPGANLQADYHILVESKSVSNLSLSRSLVFLSFFGLPIGLLATIAFGIRREGRRRDRVRRIEAGDESEDAF